MQLIIAEKREAAFAMAQALLPTNFKEESYYFYGGTNIYITWLQGHLLTQLEPGEKYAGKECISNKQFSKKALGAIIPLITSINGK
ncbi:hypothetical protein [Lysinibacillus sp. NPDC096212]|uniref:hypothetical protein n=1 Tax=unclassified Lysinibacillus TaxID=2636778 RepID=UPI0038160C8E